MKSILAYSLALVVASLVAGHYAEKDLNAHGKQSVRQAMMKHLEAADRAGE